ncbi:metallophosphoesterase [Deinococcus deserti]
MFLSLLFFWPLLSAAAPPVAETPVQLVILSDFNGAYGSLTYPPALTRAVQRTVQEWQPDAVLSAGDLVAGQKASLSDTTVRAMWASFERDVHGPLRRAGIPFSFTLGNHDASLTRDRREAARYWQAHPPVLNFVDRSSFPFQYSFTLGEGRVFVASIDASRSQLGTASQTWLAAQLDTPEARQAGVRLVLGHLPLAAVSQGKNRPGEILRDAPALRSVMAKGKVLAYIHGHHAAFYPGRLGPLNVLSSGGIGGRDYVGYPGTARSTVTLLNVHPSAGRATFQTFDADTGAQVLSRGLPARLSGLGGPLYRVDDFR